jgi:hypothetical protein
MTRHAQMRMKYAYMARTGSDTKLSLSTIAAALGISAATASSNRSVLPLLCSEQ